MSVITIPSNIIVENQTWGQQRNDIAFRSMFGAQAIEGSSPLWVSSITGPTLAESNSVWQVLIMQLKGRTNQLAMHNMARPIPLGNMRGTMTMGAASAGATSLTITATGQASKTLLAGDYIGFGVGTSQQVVMITADATADGSGVINVNVEPPLRNAFSAGTAVVWDKPKVLFRRNDNKSSWDYSSNVVSGMSLDLIEDVRP